jgi:hypothetical protein
MNNTIKQALFSMLNDAALGYPIGWPAIKFTPPDTGQWLEVSFAPNSDLDNGLSYNSGFIPRGIFQVTVFDRPNGGTFTAGTISEQIQTLFAKGTAITGQVRVVNRPDIMQMDAMDNQFGIAVSVEYSG